MMVILNSLNAHNFPIFQPILMILLSKFMVYRAFSDKTYLSLGLLSTLISNLDIDIVWAATMSNFNGHLLFQADRLSCSYRHQFHITCINFIFKRTTE